MSPGQHPDDGTLLAYATGAMPPGAALMVKVHLSFCAYCRSTLRFLDILGGALIETAQPAAVSDAVARRTIYAIHDLPRDPPVRAIQPTPAALVAGLEHGPWRPFTPGLEVCDILGSFDPHETVCLLKGKAGAAVPRHTHEGTERFVVLEGGFGVDDTVYWQGDFIESDSTVAHTPFIPQECDCLCLVALEGGLVLLPPDSQGAPK